ncbi:hypothetical protein [Pseudoalteromonas sp. A25]|uniref:hypothetical protein n=1 Tax=Pseudoalteromonas sp. A25 TaxID=116092 RepID=UPI0012606AC2|nr:hypothetical protein [Pseudoalteromonas sp. A25]
MKVKHHKVTSFVLLVVTFTLLFSFSQSYVIERDAKSDLSKLATRIALDLEMLPIAEPLFNYSGDQQKVSLYIQEINRVLSAHNSRIVLDDIRSVEPSPKPDHNHVYILESAHKKVVIKYLVNKQHLWISYIAPLIFAYLVWLLYLRSHLKARQNLVKSVTNIESERAKLVLDLNTKCIYLSSDPQQHVQLANKPLCFYIALVEFCDSNADTILNPNKDVPEALVSIANRYFERLTVLGHTVRKKPNFSNSLEKTLSEIRAALDDVFNEHPELKSKYYPPKAYGEGSRSKLHSYGLSNISFSDVDVKGK